ncbi:MAG: cation:proton antiporter [Synechococcus sp.]
MSLSTLIEAGGAGLLSASEHWFPTMLAATGGVEKLSLAVVVLELALVYLTALLGGELCRRLGFPSLLGELLGGVLIGISGLRLFVLPSPGVTADLSGLVNWVAWLHGESDAVREVFLFQGEFFRNLANVGVLVLLFEIGLGANLNQMLGRRSKVIAVAMMGVLLSMVGGSLAMNAFLGIDLIPALFMGAALSVTSLGITLQLLQQQGDFTSAETQVIIGAAMLDDIIGIMLLSLILSIYEEGSASSLDILLLVGLTSAVLVVAILAGRLFSSLLLFLKQTLTTPGRVIIPALMFAFVFVLIASGAGLVEILGAFVAGLVLQGGVRRLIANSLKPVVDAFVPIFFVYIGAETSVWLLLPGGGDRGWLNLGLVVFLSVIAVVAKLASGYAVSSKEGVNPLAVGLGMIPRGEVGLVFAEVGRISGILDPALFSILVVVSIFSTLATTVGLWWLKPEHISLPIEGRALGR